jgi:tricorn protease
MARDVYVKQIGSETVRRLTSDAAPDVSPRWSPDGRHIAFVRVLDAGEPGEFAVLIIPALGGGEHKVGTGWLRRRTIDDRLLDWFPDSENIAVADAGAKGETAALSGWNVRTGERWPLTNAMPVGKADFEPALSPDGRRLAFTRYLGTKTDVYLLDLDESHYDWQRP